MSNSRSSDLSLHIARSRALARLPGLAHASHEGEFLRHGMEIAEHLTGSSISFIHFVDEVRGEIEPVPGSCRTTRESRTVGSDRGHPIGGAGIWAAPIRARAPFVCNDYEGYCREHGIPADQDGLTRLISVPVFDRGSIVLLMGVGNRESDFGPEAVETVQLLANQFWRLTQLRRERADHRRSRELLEEISTLARAGGWSLDVPSGETRWTRSAWELHGLEPGSPLGIEEALAFFHPSDRMLLAAALAQASEDGVPYDLTARFTPRGGEEIWVRTTCSPQMEDGRVQRLVGTIQDVSEVIRDTHRERQLRRRDASVAAAGVRVREEERAMLARELHDGVGQLLTAIRMDLELIDPSGEPRDDGDPAPGTIRSIVQLTDRTLLMIQDLSSRLREPILDDLGLVPSLRVHLHEFQRRSGVTSEVHVTGSDRLIPPRVTTAVYRVVQEAATNVARHANAVGVTVRLDAGEHELIVEIEDDGDGAPPGSFDAASAFGIRGMRERVEAVGGTLKIGASNAGGTLVHVEIPLPVG